MPDIVPGESYQYQGNAVWKNRLVKVLGFDPGGLVRVSVLDRKGNPTATTAAVFPGWLAEPGKSSQLRKLDFAARAKAKKMADTVSVNFGLEDYEQIELEL